MARAAAYAGGISAEDAIVALDPPWIGGSAAFTREPNRRIAWLRCGGRIAARAQLLRRLDRPPPHTREVLISSLVR